MNRSVMISLQIVSCLSQTMLARRIHESLTSSTLVSQSRPVPSSSQPTVPAASQFLRSSVLASRMLDSGLASSSHHSSAAVLPPQSSILSVESRSTLYPEVTSGPRSSGISPVIESAREAIISSDSDDDLYWASDDETASFWEEASVLADAVEDVAEQASNGKPPIENASSLPHEGDEREYFVRTGREAGLVRSWCVLCSSG